MSLLPQTFKKDSDEQNESSSGNFLHLHVFNLIMPPTPTQIHQRFCTNSNQNKGPGPLVPPPTPHGYSNTYALFICRRFTHATVEQLSPSHDYQFRVIAENLYGRSEPCEPTALIKTDTEQEGRKKKGEAVEGRAEVYSFIQSLGKSLGRRIGRSVAPTSCCVKKANSIVLCIGNFLLR